MQCLLELLSWHQQQMQRYIGSALYALEGVCSLPHLMKADFC